MPDFNIFAPLRSLSTSEIDNDSADVIYALDMFHMVSDPDRFLKELRRLIKNTGRAYIEDGHQPREESRKKILASGLWNISSETKNWMECRPRTM